MEHFTIQKKDGNRIPCLSAVPGQPEGIVIGIHGFTSSKESPTYQMLLNRLPLAGLGVICIDLPGHGTEDSLRETLRIPGALDSIGAAEQYALLEYPGQEIFFFGSSFGAYLIGLYISTREHAGRKAFWRSAAVNMPELFHRENPTEEERQMLLDLETKGYFDMTMEQHRPVRITSELYQDFLRNDLFQLFDDSRCGKHLVAMAHGTEDEVISPGAAKRFAEKFQIPVTWFPGEGHSLSNDSSTPGRVIDLAVSHFKK